MAELQEEKVFKDPVHKYIYVQDRIIWDLINTKEFQRLRRIKQLGMTNITFHGAEHSRFSHSLGVYEITRKIISQFERNNYPDWPKNERLLCLCAALLHDIGHGPFSHTMEKVFHTNHEEWTCRMVLGDTGVGSVLRQVSGQFPQKVAEVIRKSYHEKIVVSLISSQLDADRMDYLLRDAYFTGVDYGTFDIERILRVIRPHKGRIVVKESGMHAVEDYLMSRYQMYWQVYFHPVTRSAEIILQKIFQRARILFEQGYDFVFMVAPLAKLLAGDITPELYFLLDEAFLQTVVMQWGNERDEILADLSQRFIHRRLFKYIRLDESDDRQRERIIGKMEAEGMDPQYYSEIDFSSNLAYDVYNPEKKSDSIPILLLDAKDQLAEISTKSDIVRSVNAIRAEQCYLYFPDL